MMRATIRYAAHKALERLEWLETHIDARPDKPEVRDRIADEIDDLRAFITRIITAA
jgi:hypothetical protein